MVRDCTGRGVNTSVTGLEASAPASRENFRVFRQIFSISFQTSYFPIFTGIDGVLYVAFVIQMFENFSNESNDSNKGG
jgi:hypothetical protein